MATICTYCGAPNAARDRFCRSCRKLIALDNLGGAGMAGQGQPWMDQDWLAALAPDPNQPAPPLPWPPEAAFPSVPAWSPPYGNHPEQQIAPPYAPPPYYQPPPSNWPPYGGQPYPPPYQGLPPGWQPGYAPPPSHAQGHYLPHPSGYPSPYPVPYGVPHSYPYDPRYAHPYAGVAPAPPAAAGVLQVAPGSPAEFWPRFGALMVDYCLLFVLWFAVLSISLAMGATALAILATFLGPGAYFVGFWATSGRTPGYRAAGLQMVRTDGTKPGLGTAVVRYLATVLSLSSLCLGYFWMLWDGGRQTWHDKIAGTRVINLR